MAEKRKNFKIKDYINYLLVLALAIPFTVIAYTSNIPRSTADLLCQIGFSMILAISLNLVVGFLGELSLGHAGFMCVGAYLGCYCAKLMEPLMPLPLVLMLSMLIGGLCAAVFGLLIGLPTLRLKGDYLAIVTLAFGEIIRNIFRNLPKELFGGAIGLSTINYGRHLFIAAFIMVLVTVFVSQNLMKSKHGRAIQAIRDNEIAARAMGTNVTYYKLVVFVIAAFFAGIAGVIYGFNTTPVAYSKFSFNYSIEILVMVVLGGMGNITGSVIASALLTFINIKLTTTLSGDLAALKYLIYALILILMVMWNNAPKLKNVREKYSLHNFISKFLEKRKPVAVKENGGVEAPTNAAWSKIPSKIKMDAILSADVAPDKTYEPEKPKKTNGNGKGDAEK